MQFFLPEMLVSSASADLTLQDNSKNTALHLACSKVGTHFKDMFSLFISTVAFSPNLVKLFYFTKMNRARDRTSLLITGIRFLEGKKKC